jgi:Ankyrin repeats (3 copies)
VHATVDIDAAQGGNLELVHWLMQEVDVNFEIHALVAAADKGDLHMVQALLAEGCPW